MFEAVVLALLTMDRGDLVGSSGVAASIVASLFVYRVVYYLLPLCAAIALSAIAEVIRSRAAKLSKDAGRERGPLTGLAAPDAI